MSRGVVYIASGETFLEAANKSAQSVRVHNPELSIALFTDESVKYEVFDEIIQVEYSINEKGDSILSEEHVLFDKNLYLDADTYVTTDITDMFEILDRSEIALAHNEARAWYHNDFYNSHGIKIPETFPEYNSGVIGFRNSERVTSMFSEWQSLYKDFGYERNQPALRVALFNSNLNIATLPPEYNFMTHTIGFASGNVKILHQGDSDENLTQWANLLNNIEGKKVTTWDRYPCRVVPNSYKGKRYKIGQMNIQRMKKIVERARTMLIEQGPLALLFGAGRTIVDFLTNN